MRCLVEVPPRGECQILHRGRRQPDGQGRSVEDARGRDKPEDSRSARRFTRGWPRRSGHQPSMRIAPRARSGNVPAICSFCRKPREAAAQARGSTPLLSRLLPRSASDAFNTRGVRVHEVDSPRRPPSETVRNSPRQHDGRGVRCGSHACGHQSRNSWRMAAARVWSYPIPYAIGARIAYGLRRTTCAAILPDGLRLRSRTRTRSAVAASATPAGRSGTSRLPARRSTAIPVGGWQRRGRRPGLRPVHSGT